MFKFKEYRFVRSSAHTKLSFCGKRKLSLQKKVTIIPRNKSLSKEVSKVSPLPDYDSCPDIQSIEE
jgi:hypothetical protein